jgi:hypothetical protein
MILCSPETAAVWERHCSSVPIGSSYAHVALASDESGGDCNMWIGKRRCDWSMDGLTTATSGANESVGEPLRGPARAGPGCSSRRVVWGKLLEGFRCICAFVVYV